ncbi:hypothetical protein Q7I18_01115 [Aeromonas veronii]|uniref:hypothetical protein n=1 Tax=Aeromonas veronii TaxID=654 RepID=UPI001430CF7A|nr:hypothetical protein [Aeromonas veronii]NJI21267.1 hypothetical protein [Aeromonas veronii]
MGGFIADYRGTQLNSCEALFPKLIGTYLGFILDNYEGLLAIDSDKMVPNPKQTRLKQGNESIFRTLF